MTLLVSQSMRLYSIPEHSTELKWIGPLPSPKYALECGVAPVETSNYITRIIIIQLVKEFIFDVWEVRKQKLYGEDTCVYPGHHQCQTIMYDGASILDSITKELLVPTVCGASPLNDFCTCISAKQGLAVKCMLYSKP